MTDTHVRVLSCGGTIASEPGEGGAAPAKAGQELVDRVPALGDYADLSVEEMGSHPGFDMDFETVAATARAARRAVEEDGADGVVVTHGTDTLADTAYALDVTVASALDAPVAVTGSQRRFDEPSSDAPANLLAAVRTAADDRFAGGAYVAFDDEVHAARDAVKTHTNALDTFQSPGKGPVAEFTRAGVHVHRAPGSYSVDVAVPETAAFEASVPVVHSGTGVGGEQVDAALDRGADAVVVEGTGLGNVTGGLGDAIGRATAHVPVVVSSRCHAGPTEPVYGTAGGAVTLRDHGALFAGDLSTSKARVKLVLALAAGVGADALADLFD
ncbi:MAG: asparaginase [Haloferacaceae archaeon]